MAFYKNIEITHKFLDENPTFYFIFGDNLIKQGYGGAAMLRDHPHAIGFITKKFPDNRDTSFYTVDEYEEVFYEELQKLEKLVKNNPKKIFYISQLGGGLANKYRIWEGLIKENLIKTLQHYDNVVFCWKE
jgi:hypothetical protein